MGKIAVEVEGIELAELINIVNDNGFTLTVADEPGEIIVEDPLSPSDRADVTRRLSDHIHENRHSSRYEDEMFVIKYFQKGTAHIVFKRPELVDKLNDIIARHYPGALSAR
ncbi:DUF4942 domain-containing protein [Escherichia coli]|nr:DUF5983 family protein [Escherichia coli]MCQ6968209.1 DUF4942 domain-containing protein [Escherichia coli]